MVVAHAAMVFYGIATMTPLGINLVATILATHDWSMVQPAVNTSTIWNRPAASTAFALTHGLCSHGEIA